MRWHITTLSPATYIMFTRMLHPVIYKKLAGLYVKQFKNVLMKKKYVIQLYHVMVHGSGVVMRRRMVSLHQ